MNIKPLRNNLLIDIHRNGYTAMAQVDENESKIEKATVLDVGNEVELIKKGDIIIFKAYELDTIELEGQKHNFISEDSIKAICTTTPIKKSRKPKKAL